MGARVYYKANVCTRFLKRFSPLNVQLRSARAGCGSFDLFTGSLFYRWPLIGALLKATANNAYGFALKVATNDVSSRIGKVTCHPRKPPSR